MCGIAGFLSSGAPTPDDRAAVARMCATMAHRGPDGEGIANLGPLWLGHRRLAIIDLRPEAAQPIANEDGSIWLAVNGEFYDFERVQRELAGRGHTFRSKSDSEIAVHLYEELGPRFVDRLRGMFALALWDSRSRTLLLARDRFGKKPLHYHWGPRGLTFASELQALADSRAFPLDVDPDAIDAYLALQYVPAPATAFRNVRKLEPGHLAVIRAGEEPRPERYFQLRYDAADQRPLHEMVADLRVRLDDAVRVRMVADVPVGAFLSGGIDSAAVVALMARHSSSRVRTFSVAFAGDDPSELKNARQVAERYGTEHHEMVLAPDMVSVVPELVRHYGEPYADCSAVPTWHLCRFAKQAVTVVLSGDGGDEAFAGYPRYRWARIARGLRALPSPAPRIAATTLSRPGASKHQPVRDFGRRLMNGESDRYLGLVGHFPYDERMAIYSADMRERFKHDAVGARFNLLFDAATAHSPADRLLELDVQTYLPGAILTKVDIASMAQAVEVRSPLLDAEVMALAARIPARYKLRGLRSKYVLRKAVADLVPVEILRRAKRGFDPPIDRWMRQDLAGMTRDLLLDRTATSRGWFDPAAVQRLIESHARGESRGLQLWTLLMLEQWFRAFPDRDGCHVADAGSTQHR